MFSRLTVEPRAKSTQTEDSHIFGSVGISTQRQHFHTSARAQN